MRCKVQQKRLKEQHSWLAISKIRFRGWERQHNKVRPAEKQAEEARLTKTPRGSVLYQYFQVGFSVWNLKAKLMLQPICRNQPTICLLLLMTR